MRHALCDLTPARRDRGLALRTWYLMLNKKKPLEEAQVHSRQEAKTVLRPERILTKELIRSISPHLSKPFPLRTWALSGLQ